MLIQLDLFLLLFSIKKYSKEALKLKFETHRLPDQSHIEMIY